MSTADLLPSKEDIVDTLRQLTGRSNPPGHLLAGFGIFAAGKQVPVDIHGHDD